MKPVHARQRPEPSAPGQHAPHPPRAAPGATPPQAVGNLALRALLDGGAPRARLEVGAASDPAEHEADRMADAALRGTGGVSRAASAGAPPAAPGGAGANEPLRRKARPAGEGGGAHAAPLALGAARPLTPHERGFFEPRFHADLGEVRIHDNGLAAASAAAIDARAFSLGSRIAFGAGEYQPGSAAGERLLAHELAHVLQAGDGATVRRQPLASQAPSGPMCMPEAALEPEQQVCKMPVKEDPSNPTDLKLAGTVAERVAAFKQMVKTTAIHRLTDNRTNLDAWAALVEQQIPTEDLAAIGMMQSGATGPYFDIQDIKDPQLRELRASQALGANRACTGCHIEKEISATRSEREASSLQGWSTPNELRAGVKPASRFSLFPGGQLDAASMRALTDYGIGKAAAVSPQAPLTGPAAYRPPPGSEEARLHGMFPDPVATRGALERAAPILQALGPQGYKVLPENLLTSLENSSSSRVRERILDAIAARQCDYLDLIGKIRAGEIGYEYFGPVVKQLMPLADAEVQAAIKEEMDSQHFWELVEHVVVGVMTALALLLMIFPPTTALGMAFFASLELSLGYYGVTKGNEAMRLGSVLQLGMGADDVFARGLQDQADAMVMGGFISAATGWLGIAGGLARTASAASHFVPPPTATGTALTESTALARSSGGAAARTVQQGEFVLTLAEDGSIVATASSRPDLLIIVRGDTATLYQLLEGGGMRVVSRATLPVRGAPAPAATPLLTAGGESPAVAALTGAVREGPIITPPPPNYPRLTVGPPTTRTWGEISKMRQPELWQQREIHMQELYGAAGQQHFPVPGTGGRHVDVPLQYGGGKFYFAGEVKSYSLWIGVKGQKGGVLNEVGLSDRIQTQISRDIWLRDNVPGFDPRWMFTDAPPSQALRQALRDARIVFIEYLP